MIKIEEKKKIKHLKIFFVIFFLLYYAILGFTFWDESLDASLMDDIFSMFGDFAAFMILVYGIISNRIFEKAVWSLVAVVIGLNIIGDVIFDVNEIFFHIQMPDVSICDVFYLPAAILLLIAVFLSIKKDSIYNNIKIGMDIGIIMVASATLLYYFILMPIWKNESLSLFETTLLMLYPILDLGYLAGVLIQFFHKRRKEFQTNQSKYFIYGFLLIFAADILFALDTSEYLYTVYDPFWTMGFVSLAIAALHSKETKMQEHPMQTKNERKKDYKDYFLFLLPYLIAGVFVAIISARYMFHDALAFGSTITVLMVFIRQIFTLLENDHLLDMFEKANRQLEEYSSVLEDRNEKLHELKNLREMEAQTDYLTHLHNRRYMSEWIDHYIENFSNETKIELSVLLIDVDHYKEVNDIFGHHTGDVVLKDIAALIRNNIREVDKASRYGGDEFMVILPGTKSKDAKRIAERILHAVENNHFENHADMSITLSIGNYYWSGTKESYSFHQMIQSVDEALYEAKKTGRNKIVTR